MTSREFERRVPPRPQTAQLQHAIAIPSSSRRASCERRVALEDEQREVRYAVVPAARTPATARSTPAAVAAYYEENKSQFMTPETLSLQYLRSAWRTSPRGVQVTEEGLRRYYDETAADRYAVPERRRASHILVEAGSDPGQGAEEGRGARSQRAKAGEDFAELAREEFGGSGFEGAGGDLGWARGRPTSRSSRTRCSRCRRARSAVRCKTQFGYHVIRLDDIEPPHVRTFDEVRAELEAEFRREQAQSRSTRSRSSWRTRLAALTELEAVASKLGLPAAGGGGLHARRAAARSATTAS